MKNIKKQMIKNELEKNQKFLNKNGNHCYKTHIF